MQTIVALATPLGRSGIGVVRLSGDGSLELVRSLLGESSFSPTPRVAHLKRLREKDDAEVVDEAIVTFFKAPHSFTGEDVAEISCHGSPVLLRRVIDLCLSLGARMADAGEFTLRALANGRMNLTQAEAIRDLIDAQTTGAARQAVRQMRGEFSHQLEPIKDELLDMIVVLESALEFVEDDLPLIQIENLRSRLQVIVDSVGAIADTFKAGHLIREGIRVAIVGRPNVGKSSLFNALLGSDRAIVTEIAGTTRDQLHERLTINNIPISLTDTAGLRDTDDRVESIGVERARRTMADADLVVAMLDASEDVNEEDTKIVEEIKSSRHLVAVNKIDTMNGDDLAAVVDRFENVAGRGMSVVAISARTGEGLDALRHAIVSPYASENLGTDGFLVTDARHHDLLVRTRDEILHSIELLDSRASEEIILIGLHNALRYLGQITGETTTEDMLTRIFSTFCIGK
ncbi:MAG TPA: tRNA uridine-5-carboxymethylaminomethyl(34) synthesis GTPase MnmE [Pyrinomonadaceae bacterium]|nr:tRNA uridine-5-carboxymethylaminomethyl(34) synthesis GTPase MnmE [Pyrinomonadaceae bacterium]